jgi:cell division septation protein DedD
MAKDYAKVKSKKSQRGAPSKKMGNSSLWIVAMALTGIFVAGLFFLKQQSERLTHEKFVEKEVKQNITTAAKPIDKTPQPRFDFYTMLPKAQVNTTSNASGTQQSSQPVSNAKPFADTNKIDPVVEKQLQEEVTEQVLTEAKTKPRSSISEKGNIKINAKSNPTSNQIPFVYFLQLGIFKSFEAADQLKAQMSMLGHESQIKVIHRNTLSLYRVVLGPYKTNEEAERNQEDLQNEHIRSEIVR